MILAKSFKFRFLVIVISVVIGSLMVEVGAINAADIAACASKKRG